MSQHRATIEWQRTTDDFDYKTYTRDHTWQFGHEVLVHASAAPKFLGSAELVDPEEAFVASLSSCHMLTFLALASGRKFIVNRYTDNSTGFLEKNEDGALGYSYPCVNWVKKDNEVDQNNFPLPSFLIL